MLRKDSREPAQVSGPPAVDIENAAHPDSAWAPPSGRYQGLGWKERSASLAGTVSIGALALAGFFITLAWTTGKPEPVTRPFVVNLLPLASPAEPQQDVPDGPQQVEMQKSQPVERDAMPEPIVKIQPSAAAVTTPPPEPPAPPAPNPVTVPETTAPKSIEAPPAQRVAGTTATDYSAMLVVHIDRFRRYPAIARARRIEGVTHVLIQIDRKGNVLAAQVLRSSGSSDLDRGATDTVRRASPLPAPPDSIPDSRISIVVPIIFTIR